MSDQVKIKKFAVVSFQTDNAVEAVPSGWLTDDLKFCHWPDAKPANFLNLIRDPSSSPQLDWNCWEVEVVKFYDGYRKASQKATQYVKKADVDSSDVDLSRKRKTSSSETASDAFNVPSSAIFEVEPANRLTISTNQPTTIATYDLPNTLSQQSNTVNQLITVTKNQPAINPLTTDTTTHASNQSIVWNSAGFNEHGISFSNEAFGSQPSLVLNEPYKNSSVVTTPHNNPGTQTPREAGQWMSLGTRPTPTARYPVRQANLFHEQRSMSLAPKDSGTTSLELEKRLYEVQQTLNTVLSEFRNFQVESIRVQEESKTEIKDLKKNLVLVLASQGKVVDCKAAQYLPLKSTDDFASAEEELVLENSFKSLVSYFSRIGGDTLSKNVYNILRVSVEKEFSKKLRYTSNSGKQAFGTSLLAKAIRDAIHQTPGRTLATDDAINSYIARWFRNSVVINKTKAGVFNDGSASDNKKKKDHQSSRSNPNPNSSDGDSSDSVAHA